jgi:hypothetical protein
MGEGREKEGRGRGRKGRGGEEALSRVVREGKGGGGGKAYLKRVWESICFAPRGLQYFGVLKVLTILFPLRRNFHLP